MYNYIMQTHWRIDCFYQESLFRLKWDQAASGDLPSSWQCSATLRSHFCPKPANNKCSAHLQSVFSSCCAWFMVAK